jgi:uncharacterized LabA/DUF88 family protein
VSAVDFPFGTFVENLYFMSELETLFKPNERIALFLDGANLYAAAKALSLEIDYKQLLSFFRSRAYLVRALYYTAIIEDQEYSSIRPLIDWLDYNGYKMVTKPAKEFYDDTGRRKIKGNMDIEIAVDALEMAPHLDHLVLFSGDGDFRSLVEAVQNMGRKVTVISTTSTQPSMIADELRRQADHFVDLVDFNNTIARPTSRTNYSGLCDPQDIDDEGPYNREDEVIET